MSGTETAFPPPGPVTLAGPIPSYLYQQYSDDDNLQTFIAAYNVMAQWVVNFFNRINIAYYPGLTAQLLDWVAQGLYGVQRPSLSFLQFTDQGGYNTAPYLALPYNEAVLLSTASYLVVTDDVFQRMLTWHVYKGDGFQYSTRWLKRRIHRFLNGSNGVLAVNDNTADVSVTYAGSAVTITLADGDISKVLQFAIADGVLALPFQYTFTVVLT